MATSIELGADLPQYVVLRSKGDGNCLEYMWDEEEFGEFYKFMGTKLAVDPVSPFAKLEIVPSTGSPGANIHLRSAYNNKYLKPVQKNGVWFLSATADSPNDDMGLVGTSTLFQPFTPSNLPNTVFFRYVANQYYLYIANNSKLPALDRVASLYSTDRAYKTDFEYATWESYDDKMKAKDAEIQKLTDQVAAKDVEIQTVGEENEKLKSEVASRDEEVKGLKDQVAAKDAEIQKLTNQVAAKDVEIQTVGEENEKLKSEVASRDEQVKGLKDQVAAKDVEIGELEGKVAAWEAYEEERKGKLEEEMKKLQAAWDSFQVDVTAGIDPPKE